VGVTGTEDITLRGYRADDLDAMYALDIVCFEEPFRFTRRTMRRFAEAENAHVVIAEAEGVLAGFCIVDVERVGGAQMGYVVTLDVAVAHRRRGVARTLMVEAERQAAVAGCSAMVLHVHTGNAAAMGFYAGEGFVQTGMARAFYGAGVDAEVWRKELLASSS